ncbi:CHC2 zinc finger domain-containing protein [Candidatus Azobacteroides pseudotrichonymphae]|uniref:Zinc finger CHC2-type domain-containing protein n=1 Tax=Azobacteroides pseudotrichonymphae genomovar. CFP2 TaxID=511995 RepID=B6YS95_AZOPC|nr:CHC2 zinc finger domain-containing protein [Candidatus Azobacteroides pseudotrichonymphae]BAG84067.1 hypothetical protein CFPG_P2-9 [Candidatus Azobacteroides pseudotrichonymphae genomovar. CFP2]
MKVKRRIRSFKMKKHNNIRFESSDTLVAILKYYRVKLNAVKNQKYKYDALTPFKNEKVPSFKVFPPNDTKYARFHCFSTGMTGNVYDFVMKMEHCDKDAATKKILEILGVPIGHHIDLNFKLATRLLYTIRDKNDSKPFDKNMFNIFAGVYSQYKQLYGKLDKEAHKSIKNNMLLASVDRYVPKELDIPLIDFYSFILLAEKAEKKIIEELTPDLKAEAELVVSGKISNQTEPLKANTDEDVVLAKESVHQKANIANSISYNLQMLGGIRILERQYEQPKLSTYRMLECNSVYNGLYTYGLTQITDTQSFPFMLSSPVKLSGNSENNAYCRNYSDTYRDGFNFDGIYMTGENTTTSHSISSLDFSTFQASNTWTQSDNRFDYSLINNFEITSAILYNNPSSVVKETNFEHKASTHCTNTKESIVDLEPPKLPELIDGYSKEMLEIWRKLGVTEELLIKYNVKETKDHRIAYLCSEDETIYQLYNILKLKRYIRYNHIARGHIKKFVFGWRELEKLIESGKNNDMLCIVTKSPKDALVLLSMKFDSIAPMSEGFSLPEEVMKKLVNSYTKIIFLYDNDEIGRKKAKERVAELLDRKPSGKETKIIKIFFPKDDKGKDVSDRVSNMGYAGMEVEEAVKTVKNEIEQLIANENGGVLRVKKEAEPIIANTADVTQEQITKKDRIIKGSSKRSRLISSINDECTQEYSKEFLDGLCISKEDLKQLDIWEHKKTKCAILILDVLQTFDTNKRKHDISYVYHAYNWQYTNSKISDSPGAKDYLFLMNLLHKKFPGSDELMADKPLVIASSPEDARTIYSNRTDYYVVGVIDKDFHFGEEQRYYMCYITNKFSSVTVLDMPSLAEELNNFAKEERIMPFKARIDTFEEFMKLENEELAKELS